MAAARHATGYVFSPAALSGPPPAANMAGTASCCREHDVAAGAGAVVGSPAAVAQSALRLRCGWVALVCWVGGHLFPD